MRKTLKIVAVQTQWGQHVFEVASLVIPRFFERAVVDYVEERFYNAMKSRDPRKYRGLWNDAFGRLNDLRGGSWNKAKKRIKAMDSQEKESMEEYISSMYHK